MRDSAWIERAAKTLSEFSTDKADFEAATREWHVTGKVIDNREDLTVEDEGPSCELCYHENLRWQFEIRNLTNEKLLLVGSTCIEHFNIPIVADGSMRYGADRNRELTRMVAQIEMDARREEVLRALRLLWRKDTGFRKRIEDITFYWKQTGAFTPDQMTLLTGRLQAQAIGHDPKSFDVSLRGRAKTAQLDEMEKSQIVQLMNYLKPKQAEDVRRKYL